MAAGFVLAVCLIVCFNDMWGGGGLLSLWPVGRWGQQEVLVAHGHKQRHPLGDRFW